VLRRSIAELCELDHRNDPSILAQWLGDKTHENFRAWVARADNSVLVAIENGDVLAVGSVTDAERYLPSVRSATGAGPRDEHCAAPAMGQ
jgi:hypothetical protein